ncbi:MAG: peptidylprolyl isomerase [Bacteroidales bacterium]
MRKYFIVLISLLLILTSNSLVAQDKEVILTIDDNKIYTEEFLRLFNKNNLDENIITKQALDEYMPLFINFKLKVMEAKSLGMDTLDSFKKELATYRNQLAMPYLTDEDTENYMLKEAYQRGNFDMRAKHILFTIDGLGSPQDTLQAWNNAIDVRNQALKGSDFSALAQKYSKDPSAQDRDYQGTLIKGNGGDLGYFTVFNMLYPFENAIYNMKIGDISMPIRSPHGYHLIQLIDKKPALGNIQLAHVIIHRTENSDTEQNKKKAYDAYNLLESGKPFGEVAKLYSDDKTTRDEGGLLPWFPVYRLMPQFIETIHTLKQNQYSKPFETQAGWHIIKLIDVQRQGSYEDEVERIRKKIANGDRMSVITDAFVEKVKAKHNFTENLNNVDEVATRVTDSIFATSWKPSEAEGLNKVVFTIGDKTYTQEDLAKQLAYTQRLSAPTYIPFYVRNVYDNWMKKEVIKYADMHIEDDYPSFKILIDEYKDGILLFNLTDKMVWNKAIEDTIGLENYYKTVCNNYMLDERLQADSYTLKGNSKLLKSIENSVKKGLSYNEILKKHSLDSTQLTVKQIIINKNDLDKWNNVKWEKGVSVSATVKNNEYHIIDVTDILPAQPQDLKNIRGVIISEYQEYLDSEWIDNLRKKYSVKINTTAVNNLINKK